MHISYVLGHITPGPINNNNNNNMISRAHNTINTFKKGDHNRNNILLKTCNKQS